MRFRTAACLVVLLAAGPVARAGGHHANISATSLTFASQPLDTTSAAQTVTLTNTGTAKLTITAIAITGADGKDFTETNNCGASLAAGVSCAINVTFTPKAAGTRTGTLSVSDDASGSPQTVALAGTGISVPVASLAPASLTFGYQTVATGSTPQIVKLANTGSRTLTISSIAASAGFAETNNCGPSLPAGKSCTINVTFDPTVSGPATGTLTFTDNAGDSPQVVPLTGTATDPLGSATGKTITCPSGGVTGNNTCYSLTISCPDVASMTATLKATQPAHGSSVGTVIFGTGGGGNVWYDIQYTYGPLAISTVVQNGFTAVQINFDGLPVGWISGPGGMRKVACRYATAAQWIYMNIQNNTTKPLCATGNSAGASAIGYALSHYGLASIFAMVELSSGPVFSRLDYGCICNQPAVVAPCSTTPLMMCYGNEAGAYVDPAYGNNDCSSSENTNNTQYAAMFYNDSVASADALYSYPKTDVHVLCGGQDILGGAPALALQWFNLVTTKASFECVADALHQLPNAKDAATKIASDIVSYCHLQ
jgi:hypothetical protein